MTNLTVEQLQKWYRNQLKKQSKDFIKQAEKSYKIVERALHEIEEIVGQFEEDEADELEDGTTIRFAHKVREIVQDFYVKKEITYENTEAMQGEIERFIKELWAAGRRWIKRMDKKFKALVKSMDVAMKDLTKEMQNLGKLLHKYRWVKDLERIGGRIETLHDLTFSREVFEEQIGTVRLKIKTAKEEYESAQQAYQSFSETSNVAELLNLDEQSESVSTLLRMKLNPLKKQVKKLMQHDTGVRIGPAGQKALTDYFEDPYDAIAAEPIGYPALLEGLAGLQEAIESNRLPLKDRLARRAIEEITAIRDGSIQDLQNQAKDIEERRQKYADSDVYAKNRVLESQVLEAKKNLEYHTSDMLKIRDDITRQIEKVDEFVTRIQSEIAEAFGEKVRIQVEVSLEPLLEQCQV